jgi:CheY-like chemotaxis protein
MAEEKPAGQPRLLIVEDEVMVAWALVDAVRQFGWKVCETVMTEAAAIEAATRLRPDAILMDYRLGVGGDGLAAARRIRVGNDIPIIFCTAYVAGLQAEIEALSRVRLLAKPVRPFALQQALAWAKNGRDDLDSMDSRRSAR